MNPVLRNRKLLEEKFYVIQANSRRRWFGLYKNKLDVYREKFDDKFSIVFSVAPEEQDGFFVIPYASVKDILLDERADQRGRWSGKIPDGVFLINNYPERLDVSQYHGQIFDLNLPTEALTGGEDDGTDFEIPELSFEQIVRAYHEENTVFQSVEHGKPYRIDEIDADFFSIQRLAANEPERRSFGIYQPCLERVRDAGGRYRFSDLDHTVAVRTAILLGPELGLTADRKEALDLSDQESAMELFCELLQSLRVDRSGGEPRLYKPLLLFSILQAIDDVDITENRIDYDLIEPRFLDTAELLGVEVTAQQAAYAFFYLTGDLFWNLSYHVEGDYLRGSDVTLVRQIELSKGEGYGQSDLVLFVHLIRIRNKLGDVDIHRLGLGPCSKSVFVRGSRCFSV